MPRPRDDVGDRCDLNEPAGIHDAEPFNELRHQPHVVADQDDGRAQFLLHARQRRHDVPLYDDI